MGSDAARQPPQPVRLTANRVSRAAVPPTITWLENFQDDEPDDAPGFGDTALGPAEPVENREERSPSPLGRRELHPPQPSVLGPEAFFQPGDITETRCYNGVRLAKGYWVRILDANGEQNWYHHGDAPPHSARSTASRSSVDFP